MVSTEYPQGTAVVFGGPGQVRPRFPLEPTMGSRRGSPLRSIERLVFGRFYIAELTGSCMAPQITDRWAIADRDANIRVGDLFVFTTRDFSTAFDFDSGAGGVAKRFIGINRQLGVIECECLSPPYVIHSGLSNLLWAHRVRATAPRWRDAVKLLWRIRRKPECFDAPLAPLLNQGKA